MTTLREPGVNGAVDLRAAASRRGEASGDQQGRSPATEVTPCGGARSLAFPAQLRAKAEQRNGQERVHLEGIASVVDTPYEMWDFFGPYNEIIDRSAFDETLTADPDVSFLVNHRGVTMARRKPGTKDGDQTLLLDMADTGLRSHAWVNPARTDVSDLVHAINDGDITEMSFAFMLDEGWWSDDFETFKITKVDLHRGDVSAVNYGANPYTSIAARSREILADLDGLPVGAARAALARLNLRTDLDLPQSNGRSRTTRTPAPPPAPLTAPAQEPEQSTGRSLTQIDAWLATLGQ